MNDYATLDNLNDGLAGKADTSALDAYATVEALNAKADASALENYAVKSDVDDALDLKADKSDLEDKANVSDLASKADASALESLATKTEVSEGLAGKADASALDSLAVKDDVDAALDLKADKTDLDAYATIEALQNEVDALNATIEALQITAHTVKTTTTQDAIFATNTAEDGDIIKVYNDINVSEQALAPTKDVTFDLGNATITAANTDQTSGFYITSGNVTINGGNIVANDPYRADHKSAVINSYGDSKLTLNNVKLTSVCEDAVNNGQFGVCQWENSDIEVNDGTYIEAGWYAICGNGGRTSADADLVINGGTLVSTTDFAIYKPGPNTLTVNGGFISGGAGAISANNGAVIIHGGKFNSKGNGDTGTWNDGTSGQVNAVINLNGKYGPVSLIIDGGEFAADNGVPIVVSGTKNPVTISISGGKFGSVINSEWIAEGYACTTTPDADGYYEVYKVE